MQNALNLRHHLFERAGRCKRTMQGDDVVLKFYDKKNDLTCLENDQKNERCAQDL